MAFLLSSKNVLEYLVRQGICTQEEVDKSQIEAKFAKNFNLLVSLRDGRKLLVKQERHNQEGKTAGEFWNEWQIQEFLQRFPGASHIQLWLPQVLNFNANNSIIVFDYLNDYRDLQDFYTKENVFTTPIASLVGNILAAIHRTTFNRQEYRSFFSQNCKGVSINNVLKSFHDLEQISPEVLINQIQAMIQYQKLFGNTSICILQVAKTLLCRSEQSMPTVFGKAAAKLTQLNPSAA